MLSWGFAGAHAGNGGGNGGGGGGSTAQSTSAPGSMMKVHTAQSTVAEHERAEKATPVVRITGRE